MKAIVVSVVSLALVAGAGAAALPAHAVPPVTAAEMKAAVEAADSATVQTLDSVGGEIHCTQDGVAGYGLVIRTNGMSMSSASSIMAATKKGFWLPLGEVKYLNASNSAAILKNAGYPAGTLNVRGPWSAASTRYLPDEALKVFNASYTNLREMFLQGMFSGSTDVLAQPGLIVTKFSEVDGSVTWSATWEPSPGVLKFYVYAVDPQGLRASETLSTMTNGVLTYEKSCVIQKIGAPGPLILPSALVTAPLLKVGPAAWRYHWIEALAKVGGDIKLAVVAGQKITVGAVRAKAYKVIYDAKLDNEVTISNVPGGARLAVTDPLGGIVDRCVTLKKGTLKAGPC